MIVGTRRGTALAAAVLVIAGLTPTAPAHALTPPVIDNNRLPDPAPPAPPTATAQQQTCALPREIRRGATKTAVLSSLGLDAVWPLTRGEGQRVAVIDTGVAHHARLPRLEGAGDYVSTGDGTADCDGHGTIVAGLVAGAPDPADGVGFAGVAPAATVLSIRQSSMKYGPADEPSILGYGDVDTMALAVRTAADLGATVINISSVACQSGALDDRALGAALAYAVDTKDVVVVAAAGNVGGTGQCPRQPEGVAAQWETATVAVSPGWYDDYVLTVGSVGPDGSASPFTLAGPWVDVAAPGENLLSLNPSGNGLTDALPAADGDRPISGTSYAAPIVSGLAALVRARFPELTARQVMQRIESTAHRPARGWDPAIGNGTIDPLAALGSEAVTTTANPVPAQRPIEPQAASHPDNLARDTAIGGVAVCMTVLAATLALSRRRRVRGDIPHH